MSTRREAAAWQRETNREKTRWEREDRARTFDHRREAYVAFYRAVSDYAQENWRYFTDVVIMRDSTKAEPQHDRAAEAYDLVLIYGSPQVRELANLARHHAMNFNRRVASPATQVGRDIGVLQDEVDKALMNLLVGIREELGVPTRAESQNSD